MRDPASQSHLAAEAFQGAWIFGQSLREKLQGDGYAQSEIVGAIDFAHAPFAE
jgi:hypothetical protein